MEQVPFEPWVAARQAALLRTAWLLTGDAGAAEDLVQAALVKCWPRWSRIGRMASPEAYVRRVLLSLHLSARRRRWRAEVPTAHLPDAAADGPPPQDAALVRALARLPRGQRTAVVLRFAEDLSVEQTAAAMGCSPGTVKSQTARALAALREDAALLQERNSHH